MTTTAPTSASAVTAQAGNGPSGGTGSPHSHGQELQQSPALAAAIDGIVAEVAARSALITDIRGARSDTAKLSYEALMARAADVRGRALLYPYLGSGLGNGALVELADGSVKWDMITGIGVHFLGHSDPAMIAATVRAGTSDVV
ncbi:MAG: hypothetical protein Q8L55_04920, partial [Phycisphaerales bacterium]|nr:hypothetical protein [Phycisphaerales bacterium]